MEGCCYLSSADITMDHYDSAQKNILFVDNPF